MAEAGGAEYEQSPIPYKVFIGGEVAIIAAIGRNAFSRFLEIFGRSSNAFFDQGVQTFTKVLLNI